MISEGIDINFTDKKDKRNALHIFYFNVLRPSNGTSRTAKYNIIGQVEEMIDKASDDIIIGVNGNPISYIDPVSLYGEKMEQNNS